MSNRLKAYLQKGKKPQTHHGWFLIKCGRLINKKSWIYVTVSKPYKIFSKMLPMTTSIPDQIIYDSKDKVRSRNLGKKGALGWHFGSKLKYIG